VFFFCLRIAPLPEERLTRWTADAADATTVVVDQVNVSKSSTMTARSSVFTERFFLNFSNLFSVIFFLHQRRGPERRGKRVRGVANEFFIFQIEFQSKVELHLFLSDVQLRLSETIEVASRSSLGE